MIVVSKATFLLLLFDPRLGSPLKGSADLLLRLIRLLVAGEVVLCVGILGVSGTLFGYLSCNSWGVISSESIRMKLGEG